MKQPTTPKDFDQQQTHPCQHSLKRFYIDETKVGYLYRHGRFWHFSE